MSQDLTTIYLDHNATAPILPEVAAAVADALAAGYANPSSQHAVGRRARRALEDARELIGRMLGAQVAGRQCDKVILTSGGTEANNLALFGLVSGGPGEVIISAIEHPSVTAAAERLVEQGWLVHRLLPDRAGVVHVERLADALSPRTKLVSVMLANNETGVVQPVAEMAGLCRGQGVPMHTDAAQAIGKLPVDFRALGVTAMTVAAHKFHGPLGIGALVVRHGASLTPLLVGGMQQEGLRPGTESVALTLGMCKALEVVERDGAERCARMLCLRDKFEAGLHAIWPEIEVNGARAQRLPHVVSVAFRGLDRQALLMALDTAGVACSTGSACASGSSEPSPVLTAMGCPPDVVSSSLRFSLGATTTEADVDEALARIAEVCGRLAAPRLVGGRH